MAQAYAPNGRHIPGSAEFFDRLTQADLPVPIRAPISESLNVLLEDDGDTALPNGASFSAMLRFLGQHPDLPAPSIGVTPMGYFTAGWQDRRLRFTLEFMTAGYVRWVRVENAAGRAQVDGGLTFADQVSLPDRMPQNFAS